MANTAVTVSLNCGTIALDAQYGNRKMKPVGGWSQVATGIRPEYRSFRTRACHYAFELESRVPDGPVKTLAVVLGADLDHLGSRNHFLGRGLVDICTPAFKHIFVRLAAITADHAAGGSGRSRDVHNSNAPEHDERDGKEQVSRHFFHAANLHELWSRPTPF